MKILKISGAILLVLIVIVLGFRFLSGSEDAWLCRNGQWVKHGQPSEPMPNGPCTGNQGININRDPLNTTYLIEGRAVAFVNGRADLSAIPEGESGIIEHYAIFGQPVLGDIDGDSLDDFAVIITADRGGSGTFYYATIALATNLAKRQGDRDYVYQGKNAVLLGDRIAPQTLEIKENLVIANYAERKPGEPMTAQPSVAVSKYLTYGDGLLKEIKISDPAITVNSPAPLELVSSPLVVKGEARGNWFFEASFPVQLVESTGAILASGIAQLDCPPCPAEADCAACTWMTTEFVPFIAKLEYNLPERTMAVTSGRLILKKDNPSGLPENDQQIEIPVLINLTSSAKTTVKVFFNNSQLDPEVSCNKVFPVERQVVKTQAVARAALEELLKGPTDTEKDRGYFTSINPGVKIQKLTIENGVAKVDFDETMERGMGGSCRVSAVRAEITESLKQFSTVKEVVISVNGRTEDILQP